MALNEIPAFVCNAHRPKYVTPPAGKRAFKPAMILTETGKKYGMLRKW
jgi:hypothetical protein